MTVKVQPKDIPKKNEEPKFVSLPPAGRRKPANQKPLR